MMARRYGPNDAQIRRFLLQLAGLSPADWLRVEEAGRDRLRRAASTSADVTAEDHPWLIALMAAQDAWPDAGFRQLAELCQVTMDATQSLFADSQTRGVGVDAARCAACVLFCRPWVNEELISPGYGEMGVAIPLVSLGSPCAQEPRRAGPPGHRTRFHASMSAQTRIELQ